MAKLGENRSARLKENYAKLRAAGFSAKEATRFRGSSDKEINKAILNKALPALREEKRTALKIKYDQKEFKASSSRTIEIEGTTDNYLKKLQETFRKMDKDGYNYYSQTTTIEFTTTETESFYTGMRLTKNADSIDVISDLLIEDVEDIWEQYAITTDRAISNIHISITFWKAKDGK